MGRALNDAGTNRTEILKALNDAPEAQRDGIQFLVENMPERDLTTLSAAYLKEDLSLAYEPFNKAPWRGRVSKASTKHRGVGAFRRRCSSTTFCLTPR